MHTYHGGKNSLGHILFNAKSREFITHTLFKSKCKDLVAQEEPCQVKIGRIYVVLVVGKTDSASRY